jgi:hypothetical protein
LISERYLLNVDKIDDKSQYIPVRIEEPNERKKRRGNIQEHTCDVRWEQKGSGDRDSR